jgi:hypothetical protein
MAASENGDGHEPYDARLADDDAPDATLEFLGPLAPFVQKSIPGHEARILKLEEERRCGHDPGKGFDALLSNLVESGSWPHSSLLLWEPASNDRGKARRNH